MRLQPPRYTLFPYTTLFRSGLEEMLDKFTLELQRSLDYYQSQLRQSPPAKLYITLNQQILLDYRSEEHTSELQSPVQLVCRPLLEIKIATRRTSTGTGRAPPTRSTSRSCTFRWRCACSHRDIHSFPTRRSSDLGLRKCSINLL